MADRIPLKVTSAALLVAAVSGLTWYAADHTADHASPVSAAAPAPAKAPDSATHRGLLQSRVLPVEQYLIPHTDAIAQDDAELKLEQSCMTRLGLTYDPPVGQSKRPAFADNAANLGRRYGLSDRATAEQWGYDMPGGPAEPPTWTRTAAQLDVLYGKNDKGEALNTINGKPVPKGGCIAEARQVVGTQDETTANDINGEAFKQSLSDPEVVQALASWSACMKTAGYDYKTPLEITQGRTEEGWGSSPEAKQIAVTEVDCKQSTGLLDVWFSADSRIQTRLLAPKKAELDRVKEHNRAIVRRSLTLR